MSSKNPWLVVVFGLVSLGLPAKTMAQPSVQEPLDEDGVRLGFEAPPISAALLRERSELNGDSYYGSAGEREPATAGGSSIANDGRYFNTQEASIIGPAPPRYQNVSARPDNSEWVEPALGLADGQPLHPGGNTRTLGTALTRKQRPAEVDARSATTSDKTSLIDKTANTEQSGKSPLTMWITMGLFASLAGNMFFAWVAWDTHAKYQDLVDDRGKNDGQQRRQDRRTRGDDSTAKRDCDAIGAVGLRGLEE